MIEEVISDKFSIYRNIFLNTAISGFCPYPHVGIIFVSGHQIVFVENVFYDRFNQCFISPTKAGQPQPIDPS